MTPLLPASIAPLLALWPFLSGAMLWWAAAAAAPILIHLWNRRRYQEVPWAAMEYLLAAIRKNSRRILVEQLLLLALRVAILVLFAAALAEPVLAWLAGLGSPLGSGGQTHWVFVLDASYSMDYRDGAADSNSEHGVAGDGDARGAGRESRRSRFDRARQIARQWVERSRQGDGFSLIVMADVPRVVIDQPAFDPRDVAEEIDGLRVLHGGANLAAALAEVETLVGRAREDAPRLTRRKICWFTDLGQNTWGEVNTEVARQRIGRLAEHADLVLVDVGQMATSNLAVTELRPSEDLPTLGTPVAWDVIVENTGPRPESDCTVELLVDERRVAFQRCDVAVGQTATLRFEHRFESAGEHAVEARLSPDPLGVDNHRWRGLQVRESIRALCVHGTPGAATSLALALEPTKSEHPRIRVDTATVLALLEKELGDYDCVWLSNVARLGRDEAAALHRYVTAGGGLAIFLGDRVDAESYNQWLGGENATGRESKGPAARVLPARLGEVLGGDQPDGSPLDPLEFRHPVAAAFRGVPGSGLFTVPSYRYFRLTPYEPNSASVLFGFRGGAPALVEEKIGRGRVVLFATAASIQSLDRSVTPAMPWSPLSTVRDFVSLVQELVPRLVAGQSEGRGVIVGEILSGTVRRQGSESAVTITDPEGRTDRVRLEEGDEPRWMYDRTQWSGIYSARAAGRPGAAGTRDAAAIFAVNVPLAESHLERFDSDLLPAQFSRDASEGEPHTAAVLPADSGRPMFRFLLAGVFVMLIAESLLAWRLGRAATWV